MAQREFKFRAWNKNKKIMCYDNEDDSAESWDGSFSSSVGLINYVFNGEREEGENVNEDFPYVFMLFTGLKDKNGKEIYENDIVEFVNHNTDKKLKRTVIWDDKNICFKFTCSPSWNFIGYLEQTNGTMEVIGNIFENPELIS